MENILGGFMFDSLSKNGHLAENQIRYVLNLSQRLCNNGDIQKFIKTCNYLLNDVSWDDAFRTYTNNIKIFG